MRIGRWVSRLFNRQPAAPAPRTPTAPAPTRPTSPPADTFEPGAPLRVSLGRVTGYTAAEQRKLQDAARVLGEVLNSRQFRDAVLSATFAGRPGFADEARSPQEVYAAVRAAHESFEAAPDGEVDLNLHLKNFSVFHRSVVGYTTAGSDTITTNRRFFSSYTPAEVAGHLAHEWLHKLGFEHDHAATADRPHSVPYALGELVERLAAGPLTPLS